MSLEEIIKAVCAADKTTLAKVARVLRHEDGESMAPVADPDMRLVTQREAAKRLGISSTTLWRLMREGSIYSVDVRGKKRVRMDSLRAYALGRKVVA